MSHDTTQPPKKHAYPLSAMMDDIGVDPGTLHRGQELLERIEGKKHEEKKAEEDKEAGLNEPPALSVFQSSFEEAMNQVDELLPQAAARRGAQASEQRISPTHGSFVARHPTLHAQLSGHK